MKSLFQSAVVHGDIAYFSFLSDAGSILFSYTLLNDKWSKLPYAPYICFSLAIVNEKLTTIGGTDDLNNPDAATNALLSLSSVRFIKKWVATINFSSDLNVKKWKAVLPPMPTRRVSAAVATTDNYLVVAGGERGNLKLTEVELLKTDTLQWFRASSLPQPLSYPQMTICDGFCFIGADSTIFSCSVDTLLTTYIQSIWTRRANVPVRYASGLTTVKGELFSIGGKYNTDTPTGDIYRFNPVSESWNLVGSMPTPQSHALTVAFPSGELVVASGVYQIASVSTVIVKINR